MLDSAEVRWARRRRRLGSLMFRLVVAAEALALGLGVIWYWELVPEAELEMYAIASGLAIGLPLGAALLFWRLRSREARLWAQHNKCLRRSWEDLTMQYQARRTLVTGKQRP